MMHSTIMQIAIYNSYAQLIFVRPLDFNIFHDRLGSGLKEGNSY